jgi:hypothetical protein
VWVLGERAEPGCVGDPVTDLDLLPLTLALVGYPVSRELGGRVPTACLDLGPERPAIDTYGTRPPGAEAASSDYDPEMLERLRSLGYLK